MKRLKSLLCLILTTALLLSCVSMVSFPVHAEESGTCGENLTWTLEDGLLTISGEGEMQACSYQSGPWGRAIKSVVIEEGAAFVSEVKTESVTVEELFGSYAVMESDTFRITDAVVYDLSFEKNEEKVRPTSEVTVKLPVPENMNAARCHVLYVDDNGNATDMEAVLENGMLVFTTTHFSYYAIVQQYLTGDISGDEEITEADRMMLSRYLADWDMSAYDLKLGVMDINGDGRVTAQDRMILARYLAGWGGEYDAYFD